MKVKFKSKSISTRSTALPTARNSNYNSVMQLKENNPI